VKVASGQTNVTLAGPMKRRKCLLRYGATFGSGIEKKLEELP
jgi:hypothetical protein